MTSSFHFFQYCKAAIACGALSLAMAAPTLAQDVSKQAASSLAVGPDLDLSIHHYSRILTAEGVLRESRYDEKMLRREGHVWVSRVLPKSAALADGDHAYENKMSGVHKAATQSGVKPERNGHHHKLFNYVVLSRHVTRDGDKTRLELVNFQDREVVSIAPTEYENVNFDGSWSNAFFLMDPKSVAALPLSKRASPVTSARWREQEKNGLFQRVLWDDMKLVPLIVETGDRAGNFFERVEVKLQPSVVIKLPWQKTQGFAAKEYADFLD